MTGRSTSSISASSLIIGPADRIMNNINLKLVAIGAVCTMLSPGAWLGVINTARATTLTVASSSVSLDTGGEAVNAIELSLSFDPSIFSIASMNDGGSIVSFWVKPPAFSNTSGTIVLAGVIPGGITTTSGTIISYTLVPHDIGGRASFSIVSARVLLDDGEGSEAKLVTSSTPFSLTALIAASSSAAKSLPADLHAPDPFVPEVVRSADLFEGQYALVFSTTDQGSGMDHYDVMEVPPSGWKGALAQWQPATSPYLLKDQTLRSAVYVRAIDNAGNFRTVQVVSLGKGNAGFPFLGGFPPLGIGLGILILILLLIRWRRIHS